jgi:purine-nucleoside phosphorylase
MTHGRPNLYDDIQETVEWLEDRVEKTPDLAMILGSGLGAMADEIEDPQTFPYEEIPHFPVSGVEGHAGELVFGKLEGTEVVVMSGRVHYYEGWELHEVTFPVRTFGELGTEHLMVTNSAGGANPDFSPGDLMLITDHINMTGANPLHGDNESRLGPRFPDMSDAYAETLREVAVGAADELDIDLQEGVYTGVAGPSYETPAEIDMIQTIGGDAVGMSTVPEVIAANHMGMNVMGISCITNMAAGLQESLDHDEVKEVASRVRSKFASLVRTIVDKLAF